MIVNFLGFSSFLDTLVRLLLGFAPTEARPKIRGAGQSGNWPAERSLREALSYSGRLLRWVGERLCVIEE